MPSYLTTSDDTPLTAQQLANNGTKPVLGGMLTNGMAGPVNPNQSPENLAQLARNRESAFLTNPPSEERKKMLAGIPAQMINKDFVEGFERARASSRDDQKMDILNEQQAWGRTDRMEKRQIDAGMRQAADEGGYEGVIDFLKSADPDRAMEYQSKKIALDQDMMKSTLMASLLPSEQAKAMVEGYGIIGKMGMALLNAPDKDKQNLYQTMLPMLRKINPNAPDNVVDAVPMFMLSAAQATPENILFKANNDVANSTSRLGRIGNDIDIRWRAGFRPETDPTLQALIAEQQKAQVLLQQAQINLTNTQINQTIKGKTLDRQVLLANETINKNLQADSKDFNGHLDLYSQAKGYIERLKTNPDSAYDQIGLARTYGMGLNKGAYSEADNAITFAAYGVPNLKKKLDAMLSGEKVALNKSEQAALIKTVEGNMQQALKVQNQLEKGYENSATSEKYRDIVSWKDIRKPSDKYYSLINNNEQNMPTINGRTATPDRIAMAIKDPVLLKDFIEYYGYDPTKYTQQQEGQ